MHAAARRASYKAATSSGRLRNLPEAMVALFEERGVRALRDCAGKQDTTSVEALDGVSQSRAIMLSENVGTDLDHTIGAKAYELSIEDAVVQSTERQSVGDNWLTHRVGIRNDVGGLKQLFVPQSAKSALTLVRT